VDIFISLGGGRDAECSGLEYILFGGLPVLSMNIGVTASMDLGFFIHIFLGMALIRLRRYKLLIRYN